MVRVSLDSGRRNRFSGRERNRERDETRDPSRGNRRPRGGDSEEDKEIQIVIIFQEDITEEEDKNFLGILFQNIYNC